MLQIQSLDEQGCVTRVELDPSAGAVVRSYVTQAPGRELQWFVPASAKQPACFAMVPFCSRIDQANFFFEEQQVSLTPNNLPEPHAIHGHGFQRSWQVLEADPDTVLLGYSYPQDAWPWRYRTRLRYTLRGRALRVDLAVQNLSARTMPVGLGLHPYLPCGGRTRLRAQVSQRLQLDAALLPLALTALDEGAAFSELAAEGILPGTRALDHVFLGWDGQACVEWPEDTEADVSLDGMRMNISSSCPYLVIWSPTKADFVCVEGVSNLPDAFNGRVAALLEIDEGFTRLPPQAEHTAWWCFHPELMTEER